MVYEIRLRDTPDFPSKIRKWVVWRIDLADLLACHAGM